MEPFIQDPIGYLFGIGGGADWFSSAGSVRQFFRELRWFVMFLDSIVIIWLAWLIPKALKFRPHIRPHKANHKARGPVTTLRDVETVRRWNDIVRRLAVATPDALKIAVIDADKLVDDALKRLGVAGEHMADRLEKLPREDFKTLDRVWDAHRVRNNLVHTPGFQLSADNTKRTLGNYEAFLRELKVF